MFSLTRFGIGDTR